MNRKNKKPFQTLLSATGVLLLVLGITFSGCHEKDHHETEVNYVNSTVDTSSNVGDTLAYFLPTTFTYRVPVISTAPTNGMYSALVQDPSTSDWIYYYSAKEGFSGTELVVIDSDHEDEDDDDDDNEHHHHGAGIREGGCYKEGGKTINRLTLNIQVGETKK